MATATLLAVTVLIVAVTDAYKVGQCEAPLMAELPNTAFTASSSFPQDRHKPHNAKIYSTGDNVWGPAAGDNSPYLQVNLGTPRTIRKVATGGRVASHIQFVKTFKLSYSVDGSTFIDYNPYNDPAPLVLQGNVDTITVKETWLPISIHGVIALRFHPLSWQGYLNLRAEAFGC